MKHFFSFIGSIFLPFFFSRDDSGNWHFQVVYFWSTSLMLLFFRTAQRFLSDPVKNASLATFLITLAGLIAGILATYKMGRKKKGSGDGLT